jgi:hypothetical protein
MKLKGSITIDIYHPSNDELIETLDVEASEFGLEETGVRNYDGEKGYRGLFIYFNQEYGFKVLAEIEEMNHRITEFDYSVHNDNGAYIIEVGNDDLTAYPSSSDYDDDDWY